MGICSCAPYFELWQGNWCLFGFLLPRMLLLCGWNILKCILGFHYWIFCCSYYCKANRVFLDCLYKYRWFWKNWKRHLFFGFGIYIWLQGKCHISIGRGWRRIGSKPKFDMERLSLLVRISFHIFIYDKCYWCVRYLLKKKKKGFGRGGLGWFQDSNLEHIAWGRHNLPLQCLLF